MTSIHFRKETSRGNMTCKIVIDKENALGGNKRGNKNYLIMKGFERGYREKSMLDTYKQLKSEGYKVVGIF